MGKGYKHGGSGGAALNFNVKTYPSETELKADKPRENTIGVITTTTMTSWVFSATEPAEPAVGMVWFDVGTGSLAEFNALKKNGLYVYPQLVKQYVSGAWGNKPSFIYQDGEWVDFLNHIIKDGKVCGSIECIALGLRANLPNATAPVMTQGDGYVAFTVPVNGYNNGIVKLKEKVDLTNINTIEIDMEQNGWATAGGGLHVWSNIGTYCDENVAASKSFDENTYSSGYEVTVRNTVVLDVSNLSGEYYIGFNVLTADTFASTVKVYDWKYE